MAHISDIKLIRTDTTLDLSQKAEKAFPLSSFAPQMRDFLSSSKPHMTHHKPTEPFYQSFFKHD
ncbi:hypothetical protein HN51_002984 [Arachis hypogaea]